MHHSLSHYFSKVVHHDHPESSLLYHTSSLDAWPSELVDKPDRFVDKIEACSAHTTTPGHDGHHPPTIDKHHCHTFLRVTVAPTTDLPAETIFIERVLIEQGRPTHSVIPVAAPDAVSPFEDMTGYQGDTLHDHACVLLQGSPSALIHADEHNLVADHTTRFAHCPDRQLSLYELAILLRFVSARGAHAVSIGLDTACETYSRWFARTTMSALAPVIMRGASHYLTPPKGEVASQIELTLLRSVNAWLRSTFKEYPLEEVAAENLERQMKVMNEIERAKMLVHIAEREEEKKRHERLEAMYQAKMAELKLAHLNANQSLPVEA